MKTLTVGMKANYTWEYEGRRVRRFGFTISKIGRKYATLIRIDDQTVLEEKNEKMTLTTYRVPVVVRVLLGVVEPLNK
jgi:hypothetical protein